MEIKNSSEISSRVNRATLFYGIPGAVLLVLGGLPLLGRVWAHLTTFGLLVELGEDAADVFLTSSPS